MARYKAALRKRLGEDVAGFDDAQLTRLASTCVDSFLFAGGRSVVTGGIASPARL